jgi:hypothetical protein
MILFLDRFRCNGSAALNNRCGFIGVSETADSEVGLYKRG